MEANVINPVSEQTNVLSPSQIKCPNCQNLISFSSYFCPNCGKKIKNQPQSTAISRQIFIYLISIFIPPSGLWFGYKYLKQNDSNAKKIGLVAILLTLISLILTIWLTINTMTMFNQLMENQLNQIYNF